MNNRMTDHISDVITHKLTSAYAYFASMFAGAAGIMSINEWAVLIGILGALFTYGLNWFHQRLRTKREARYLEMKSKRESEVHELNVKVLLKQLQAEDSDHE